MEKQLNYANRYMPELETLFEDEEKLSLTLDLGEVYKIITQTAYYLQKAQIEVVLPDELVNVVVPRASINAKVKASRSGDLLDIFNTTSSSAISLDDILEFSYEIALGNDKLSLEEFKELVKDSKGLVKYKNKYILVDQEESKKILDQIANADHSKMTRMQLIHASMSGQLDQYDFDYDEAFANILKDFTKPIEVTPPKGLKGDEIPQSLANLYGHFTTQASERLFL